MDVRSLDGLKVIDFGQGIAGPYCGQLLGDQGADVIKVEPPRGDWSRQMGRADRHGLSLPWLGASVSRIFLGITVVRIWSPRWRCTSALT